MSRSPSEVSWTATGLLVLAMVALLYVTGCIEKSGVERAPTAKAKLCACIIRPVDSVPKPVTEGV